MKTSHRGYGSNSGQYMRKRGAQPKINFNVLPMKIFTHDCLIIRGRSKFSSMDTKEMRNLGEIFHINALLRNLNENWIRNYSRLFLKRITEKVLNNFQDIDYLFYIIFHFLNYLFLFIILK